MNKYSTGKTYLILVSFNHESNHAFVYAYVNFSNIVPISCIPYLRTYVRTLCNAHARTHTPTVIHREAVSTVRQKLMLSIKLTDSSATMSGISLILIIMQREEDKVRV